MNINIIGIKNHFKSQDIILSDVWLESCIQWCLDEALPPNFKPSDLQAQIYEQWLLLDLREVGIATLPPNLSRNKYYILNGNYCLQVMEIIDISKPKLWQLQRIQNKYALTKSTDQEDFGTGKRMLQLVLTDGVQEVQAMEYRPIPALKLTLSPGIKIRILGPITIRHGQLMLEPRNVKLLDGEVEELIIPNAAENVLARRLNLPLNPNPQMLQEIPEPLERVEEYPNRTNSIQSVNTNLQNNQRANSMHPNVNKINPTNNYRQNMNEEEMVDEEIELLLEAEKSLLLENHRNVKANQKPPTQSTSKKQNLSNSLDGDDDVFNAIDIDAHLDEAEKLISQPKSQPTTPNLPKPNVISVKKLLERKPYVFRGVFKIKAKFKEVVEKLDMNEQEFTLVIKVEDDSGELVAKLHSDIVTKFGGSSPAALLSLKNDILKRDPNAVQEVVQVLEGIKQKVLSLNCVMDILLEKDERLCTIIKLEE